VGDGGPDAAAKDEDAAGDGGPGGSRPLGSAVIAWLQGLTLFRFSAHREHCLSHVVRCSAGVSDRNG
jgi:hypothetical protein